MPSCGFCPRSTKDDSNKGQERICKIGCPSPLWFGTHPTTNTAEGTLYKPTTHVQLKFSLLQDGQPKTPSSNQFDEIMSLFAHCTSERDNTLDSRAYFILSYLVNINFSVVRIDDGPLNRRAGRTPYPASQHRNAHHGRPPQAKRSSSPKQDRHKLRMPPRLMHSKGIQAASQ